LGQIFEKPTLYVAGNRSSPHRPRRPFKKSGTRQGHPEDKWMDARSMIVQRRAGSLPLRYGVRMGRALAHLGYAGDSLRRVQRAKASGQALALLMASVRAALRSAWTDATKACGMLRFAPQDTTPDGEGLGLSAVPCGSVSRTVRFWFSFRSALDECSKTSLTFFRTCPILMIRFWTC